MRLRGFEVVSSYQKLDVAIPRRKTHCSAGYDIAAAEDSVLQPKQVTLVPTGIKVYMQSDEYLGIHIRSGLASKNSISLINGQGIIDADYYDNPDNEGHILIALFNHGDHEVAIRRNERIAQGIFYKYLKADNDSEASLERRAGGLGSTGR